MLVAGLELGLVVLERPAADTVQQLARLPVDTVQPRPARGTET